MMLYIYALQLQMIPSRRFLRLRECFPLSNPTQHILFLSSSHITKAYRPMRT